MTVRRKQWIAVGALTAALVVLGYVSLGGIEKNLVYYLNPDELIAKGVAAYGATVRLGGLVQKASVVWNQHTLALRFRVGMQAEGGQAVAVEATGAPPQMFQEGMGAVVEGQFDGHIFHADRVMVKHSNEYRPPASGETPKDVYGTLAPAEENAPK